MKKVSFLKFSFRVELILGWALLLYAILLGLSYWSNHPFLIQEDTERDYLVAHHIARYAELPKLGPWNTGLGIFVSPVYFYILAVPLKIHDTPMFMDLMKVAFTILSLITLYILMRLVFNPAVAIATALLYIFSQAFISQLSVLAPFTIYIPFMYISFIFLYLSYIKRRFVYLLFSVAFFIFAAAISVVVNIVAPAFISIAILILKDQKRTVSYYVIVFQVVILVLLLFYAPTLNHIISYRINPLLYGLSRLVNSPSEFWGRFVYYGNILVHEFFSLSSQWKNNAVPILITATLIFLNFYSSISSRKKHKQTMILAVFVIISGLITVSTINRGGIPGDFSPHIYALYSFVIIYIIILIFGVNFRHKTAKVFPWLILLLFIYLFTFDKNSHLVSFQRRQLIQDEEIPTIVAVLKSSIITLQSQNSYNDFSFFQVKQFKSNFEDPAVFWNPLEREFNQKFTKVYDYVPANSFNVKEYLSSNFITINRNDYIFWICSRYLLDVYNFSNNDCIEEFYKQYPKHSQLSPLYVGDYHTLYISRLLQSLP